MLPHFQESLDIAYRILTTPLPPQGDERKDVSKLILQGAQEIIDALRPLLSEEKK